MSLPERHPGCASDGSDVRGNLLVSHAARRVVADAKDERKEMTFEEAEVFVLAYLDDGRKHTTQDIDAASARRGKRCPDSTVRFLSRLRLMGRIEGELSPPHRTWLWWRPDHPDAPEPPVA